jgi:hypothetical protein
VAIDAREAAPSNAHQRMFVDGNPPPSSVSGKISKYKLNEVNSLILIRWFVDWNSR